jgi:undecaprenyl pyrophosphate phosphatase UppP
LIIVGTVPIVIVGLLFADWLEGIRSPAVVAVTLTIGGVGLIIAERVSPQNRDAAAIGYGAAFGMRDLSFS